MVKWWYILYIPVWDCNCIKISLSLSLSWIFKLYEAFNLSFILKKYIFLITEHDGEKKFRKLPGYKIQNAYKINTFKIAYNRRLVILLHFNYQHAISKMSSFSLINDSLWRHRFSSFIWSMVFDDFCVFWIGDGKSRSRMVSPGKTINQWECISGISK